LSQIKVLTDDLRKPIEMSQYQESQLEYEQTTPDASQDQGSQFVPLTQREKRSAPESQQQSQKRNTKASLATPVTPPSSKTPKEEEEENVYEQMVYKAGEDLIDQVMDPHQRYNNDFTIDWTKNEVALKFVDEKIPESQRDKPIPALIRIRETKKLFKALMYNYEAEQKAKKSTDENEDDDDNNDDDDKSNEDEAKLRLDVAVLILMVYYGTCVARNLGGSFEIQVLIDQVVSNFDNESTKWESHEFVAQYGEYLRMIEGGIGDTLIFLLYTNATLVEKADNMIRFSDFAASAPIYVKTVKELLKN
jgi:hypothetical protein